MSLIFVARSYAEGAYQRTDDRKKTLVWNNDPKPGDTATWSGARDKEGYATGPGTLTWSRLDRGFSTGSNLASTRKRVPIATYSGTMAHGKFNGGVMTVDRGKTYHATFLDGQRKGSWSSGPLITKAESAEPAPAVEKTQRPEPVRSTSIPTEAAATPEKASVETKPTEVANETVAGIPAAGPEEQKPEVSEQKSETTRSNAAESSKPATPLIAQASTKTTDESATPRQPVTRKEALAPGAVRAIEKPGGATAKKTETQQTKRAEHVKIAEEKTEKPTKPANLAPSPETKMEVSEEIPAEGPPAVTKEEIPQPPVLHTQSSPPAAKETPVDDSIRALTGPPTSLKTKAPAPESATGKNPSAQAATTPPVAAAPSAAPAAATPKLTAVNAMDIADIEARTRGYDLGEYQLPKAEYNATNDTWSVSYVGRDADGTSKKFSVIIQDKSSKAEVKR